MNGEYKWIHMRETAVFMRGVSRGFYEHACFTLGNGVWWWLENLRGQGGFLKRVTPSYTLSEFYDVLGGCDYYRKMFARLLLLSGLTI